MTGVDAAFGWTLVALRTVERRRQTPRFIRIWFVTTSLTRLFQAHGALPIVLRVWFVVPLTVVLVVAGGTIFTLPPGPLCDEGMVLFMEGGCDWGLSNAFFFSKLGLLLVINLVFILACRLRVREWRGFLPHLAVLLLLTIFNYSDEDCRHYYSHPNGSIGQMTAEAMAFAGLGIALATRGIRQWRTIAATVVAWNGLHVLVFYLALSIAKPWTWAHTIWMIAFLSVVTAAVARVKPQALAPG